MAVPIAHLEFRSADFTRTAAFYNQLFDWQTQQNASATYMKFDGAEGGPSGGWVKTDLMQAPGPVPYLLVDDLAAKMAEIEKAGGRVIVASMPFAGGGETGLFADPDGNVLGLWMRKRGAGAEASPAAAKRAEPAAGKTAAAPAAPASTAKAAAKAPAPKKASVAAPPKPKKK